MTLGMFQKAITERMLTEELFTSLMELLSLREYNLDLDRVSVQSVEQHPTSPKLWLARLKHMAAQASALKDILGTLRMAIQKVPSEASWDIWQFGLNFFACRDRNILETLMEKACRCAFPQVCQPAKEWCLTWTFRQGGIKKARNIYRRLKSMRPITVEFYRCYILIEASQMEPNLKLIRGAFEECLTQFGTTDIDVWLNYMEMEKTVAKDVTKSGRLQERALHVLNPNLKEGFLRQLTMTSVTA